MKQPSLFDGSEGPEVRGSEGPKVRGSESSKVRGSVPPIREPSNPRTPGPSDPPDQAARDFAIAPENDVVLEASAGTGKTRVLVDRYVRLIEKGVDPRHILAITFTRKAAAEMRERVLAALRRRAAEGGLNPARWRELQQRISEIQIS